MQVLAHEIHQLVSVLARRRDSDGACGMKHVVEKVMGALKNCSARTWPIEVHVSELVGQLLDLVGRQKVVAALLQHHEVGRGDGALGDALGHEEKVPEAESGDCVVHDRPRWRVFKGATRGQAEDPEESRH